MPDEPAAVATDPPPPQAIPGPIPQWVLDAHPGTVAADWRLTESGAFVHTTASVGRGARVAERASVGRGARVAERASVGPGARVAEWASVGRGARVAEGVSVGPGARVAEWQSFDSTPLYILGSRNPAYHAGRGLMGIGCTVMTFADWREKAAGEAAANGYTEQQIREYTRYFEWIEQRDREVFPAEVAPRPAP